MRIGVFGAGSLGSLLGGLLARRHEVTLVGRDEHMRAVATEGLKIVGEIERTAPVAATTDWSGAGDIEVALVTVKSYDTDAAAEALSKHVPPIVLSIQNGLGSVNRLSSSLPARSTVLAGVTTYGAVLIEPGVVRCTGRGEVLIGDPDGGPSAPATEVASAFRLADVNGSAADDMPRRRWEKLAINAGINPVTALAQVSNGAVLEDPLRPIAITAAREVATVAASNGISLDRDTGEALVEIARQTRDNESSMARDMRRGRRTEIDAISGSVLDRAQSGEAPVNRVLYGLVAGYERGQNFDR